MCAELYYFPIYLQWFSQKTLEEPLWFVKLFGFSYKYEWEDNVMLRYLLTNDLCKCIWRHHRRLDAGETTESDNT